MDDPELQQDLGELQKRIYQLQDCFDDISPGLGSSDPDFNIIANF